MNGIKIGSLTLLGIGAYLIFLVLQLPITHVLARLEPLPEKIRIYGAQGTIIAGNAALVEKENWRLENFTWKVRPWALLKGCLEFVITFQNIDETRGRARVGVTLFGQTYLARPQVRLRLNTLEPLWRPMIINLGGWIDAKLDHVTWSVSGLDTKGQVILENVVWESNPPLSLGDFLIALETVTADNSPNRMVRGQLSDRGGPIGIQGQLQLDSQGAWRLTGTLASRSDATPKIRQMLSFLGQPDQDGRFPISFNGRLPILKQTK
ncbi:general secretion pathway protein N [Gammaproteobacteria bacterium]